MLIVCYQAAASVLAQTPRQWPIKNDGEIASYLGILRRLCPPTSCQKEKPLANEQVKLENRRAVIVVVPILGLLKTWFTPLRLRYFSREQRCSALD